MKWPDKNILDDNGRKEVVTAVGSQCGVNEVTANGSATSFPETDKGNLLLRIVYLWGRKMGNGRGWEV